MFKEGYKESYYEDTIFMKKSFAADRLFGIMELLIGGRTPYDSIVKRSNPHSINDRNLGEIRVVRLFAAYYFLTTNDYYILP